jgi:hypothetical protein
MVKEFITNTPREGFLDITSQVFIQYLKSVPLLLIDK